MIHQWKFNMIVDIHSLHGGLRGGLDAGFQWFSCARGDLNQSPIIQHLAVYITVFPFDHVSDLTPCCGGFGSLELPQ